MWADIKSNPPREGQPIIATDGDVIIAGEIVGAELVGAFLTSEEPTRFPVGHLTHWMPGRGYQEQTADEMFRELGYIKSDNGLYVNHAINSVGGKTTVIEVQRGRMVLKWGYGPRCGTHRFNFTKKEILACAQLIKETEEKK